MPRLRRDPCDDAGGHVRAPIERTARAIERGPQPTRIADCCFARAARAARSDRHLHWFAFSRQHLMRGRRCCSQVTQEGCARVWRTWPILPRQYASRGAEDGACRVRIECGGRFVGLSTRNIDPVCLSVCPHVSSCFAVPRARAATKVIFCFHALAKLNQSRQAARHARLSMQIHGPGTGHPRMLHALLTEPTAHSLTRDAAGGRSRDAADTAHAHRARKRMHAHTSTRRRLTSHACARACVQRTHVGPPSFAASCAAGGEAGGGSGGR